MKKSLTKMLARMAKDGDVETVAEIIEAVRTEGDSALRRFEEKFDRVKLQGLEAAAEELEAAMAAVTPEFLGVLERSAIVGHVRRVLYPFSAWRGVE